VETVGYLIVTTGTASPLIKYDRTRLTIPEWKRDIYEVVHFPESGELIYQECVHGSNKLTLLPKKCSKVTVDGTNVQKTSL
jgi:hypothetical protein